MRRFTLALLVGLLAFSASGLTTFVADESCTGYAVPGQDDGNCPPTCVTCGCCVQPVEPTTILVVASPDAPAARLVMLRPELPRPHPHDILHVPKPSGI